MNKPVFENVIGDKVDVGNVLDDTLAGGAATHMSRNDAAHPLDDDPSRAPGLALLQDEKDGRRSIEALGAAPEGEKAAPAVRETAPVADLDAAQVKRVSADDLPQASHGQNSPMAHEATDAPAVRAGGPSVHATHPSSTKTETVIIADRSSAFVSDAPAASGAPAPLASWHTINGSAGNDTIDGRNYIVGPTFQYLFDLHHGHDVAYGSGGADQLWGGDGNDILNGWKGHDTFWGGEGNDTISYADDTDVFSVEIVVKPRSFPNNPIIRAYRYSGSADADTVHMDEAEGFILSNDANGGDAFVGDSADTGKAWSVLGLAGIDALMGGGAGDTMEGGVGADALEGMGGNDSLFGNNSQNMDDGAQDVLWGGQGDDTLQGSSGDILIGDVGNDLLVGGWVIYGTYNYTHSRSFPNAPSGFNFTYTDDNIGRTVNLATGKVTGGAYTDTLVNVWQVSTGSGSDKLIAAGFSAWFQGGGGNDSLYGGAGNDTLLGGTGFDSFYGSGGNDVINGEGDSGVVDYISLDAAIRINLAQGFAVKSVNAADALSNIFHAQGTNFDDSITGDANGNNLLGAGGKDTIDGAGGNDTINGNAGNDSIGGGANNDLLYGEDGNDTLDGGGDGDELHGGINEDSLSGGLGDDKLYGEWGYDTLLGGDGNDTLDGGEHEDLLQGEFGNDSLLAGSGNDTLDGGAGADTMIGGAGNDVYHVNDFNDQIIEQDEQGVDTVHTSIDWDASRSGFHTIENVTAAEGTAPVKLTGNLGANIIIGNAGDNSIDGGQGADQMTGGLGNDTYHIDSLSDHPHEFRGLEEGEDWAYIHVNNFDASKLVNIEHIILDNGLVLDNPPTAPTIAEGSDTIDENYSGQVVRIESSDVDGHTVVYELLTLKELFDINLETGWISLKAPIDFENPPAEMITDETGSYFLLNVRAQENTAGNLYSDTSTIRISVNNVDEAPSAPVIVPNAPIEISEAITVGTSVVQLQSTDPEGKPVTYSFANGTTVSPGGKFSINGNTIEVHGKIDYDASTEQDPLLKTDGANKWYELFVVATDVDGSPTTSSSTKIIVKVTDVDDRPNAPRVSGTATIAENSHPTQTLVTVFGSVDPQGTPVTYDFSTEAGSNPGNRFVINGTTGEITLASDATINFEATDLSRDGAGRYYELKVVAVDEAGDVSSIRFVRINVTDVDEAPSIPNEPGKFAWAEGTGAGVTLALVQGSMDPEGKSIEYYLSNTANSDANGRFQVGKDGRISLKTGEKLDFEASDIIKDGNERYFVVKVVAKDPALNSSAEREVRIYVTPVDEAPNAPASGLSAAWGENTPLSTDLLTVTGSVDPEKAAVSYAFDTAADANPGGLFEIAANGKITLAPTKTLDYEAVELKDDGDGKGKYYALKVVAKDQTGHTSTPTIVKIYVTDDNDLPTGVQFKDAPPEVVVGMGAGSPIIRAEAIDPDRNNGNNNSNFLKNKYKFADGSLESGKFMIDADTGEITLKEALTPLDAHQHTLEVITYDEGHPATFVTATYQFTVQSASSPYIWAADPETDVPDNGIASPFTSVMVSDANRAGLYLEIRFDPTEGELDLSELSIMYDAWEYDAQSGVLKLKGSMQDIISALPHVRFDPKDRPEGEVDDSLETTFHMALVDEATGAEIATNDTVVVNSIVANRTPTIEGDDAQFTIADNETVNLVTPFAGITINDTNANDFITVTITASGQHSGEFIDANGNVEFGSYTISGFLQDVLDAVRALKFNPTDRHGVAAGEEDVTAFSIDVQDNAGASVSFTNDITVKSVVANRAPGTISLFTTDTVAEDIGQHQVVSELRTFDDNGDVIVEYRLDEMSDKFYLKNEGGVWSVYVKDALDFETAPHVDGDLRWYEIKVSATDGDAWSTSQTLKIFVQDIEPDNAAPVIVVDPNGKTEWPVDDSETVAPFQDLTFVDADDASITVIVSMNYANQGAFILPNDADFTDLVVDKNGLDAGTIMVTGHQARITEYIKLLAFNPANNLGQAGDVVSIGFSVTALDESSFTTRTVTVETTVTGNPQDNVAPKINVDPSQAETQTTDWATDPVSPFLGVTLEDTDGGSESQTLTISFNKDEGTLNAAALGGTFVETPDRITWTFNGNLATLQGILAQLTFNAAEHQAPSPNLITTTFTITLDDHHHAFPTKNEEVKVVTEVKGPPTTDDAPIIGGLPAAPIDATANSGTVAPFGDVTVDNDDGQATTATITFLDILGELAGNGLNRVDVDANGIVTYIVTGTDASSLQDLLRALSFNPRQLAVGATEDIVFTVTLTDSGHPTAAAGQTGAVTVRSAAGNEPPGDDAPTVGGLGIVDADANSGTVAPFGSVTIANDDGQATTATITFLDILGQLTGDHLTRVDADANGIVTYIVTGTNATDLQTKLRALSFDPRPLNAGQSEDIAFTVTLTDFTHPTDGQGQSGTATVHSAADGGGGNQAPTDLGWSGNWAREWSQNGFTIGSLLPVDPDDPATSYSFKFVLGTDGDGKPILSDQDAAGRFFIDGDRLRVLDGTKLDFEAARSHKVTIQVSDGSNTFQKDMIVTVRDWFNESGVGTSASETFKGGVGDDVLDGNGGNDVLYGGYGFDDLTGGDGQDAFVFDTDLIIGEFDFIQDFAPGEDTIRLEADVFQLWDYEGGALTDDVFATGAAATTELQRIIYDIDTGSLYYDEDGSGEVQAILIAMLVNLPTLDKANFLVI